MYVCLCGGIYIYVCIYIYIYTPHPWASQVALLVKNPPANVRDITNIGSTPGSERSLGGGHGNPFQYSFLENPMNRRAWRATVHRIAKSQTQLKWLSMNSHTTPFFHLSVDGHLCCFHVMTIVNSAAMNIGVHVESINFKLSHVHRIS